jgi:hypothetical protein
LNQTNIENVERFILDKIGNVNNEEAKYARKWLRWQIDDDYEFLIEESRAGCPVLVPGLRAQKFWDRSEFSWVDELLTH